ncbi:ubiquitin-conjugating enzyme (huntingtin interacting protein 2) [Sporothrix schenckii 1099-18]|uniref:Ubiquitin-conjugating enzyme E2 2 n=1 Tax=Sporothrix schenckii 1099-18 TaxID=1397361 RepID=A0A0F2MHN5_SPOSC|nr:ubiquitin-conjugating enzyme (huntingtin interacting protein 2) [Sporothrix schenckii 1099-18]KJR87681.1 ubiquitin-conjugating enzyme (huntingtin interacting protein 2) [Sporothrix schenckii 1099-18]
MPSSRDHRIARELLDIEKDKDNSGVFAHSVDGVRLDRLKGSFPGPPDTPYATGTFVVNITVPEQYPFKAPEIRFETRVWHPNISSQTGYICLDVLSRNWSPVNTIKTALLSLRMLLETPNASDPQDAEVASMLLGNPEQFKLVAHDWAVRYAGATRTLPQPGTLGPFQTPSPAVDPRSYAGYNKNLVDRFADMGFSVASVVAAFTQLGVDRRDGRDYEMEPGLIGDVTSCLFNE